MEGGIIVFPMKNWNALLAEGNNMTKNNKQKPALFPHSNESEMMVLGCMLTSEGSLNIGADGLDESDFYFTEHKLIFDVLKRAYTNNKPADVHLVCEELKRIEKLEAIGGAAYVATLAQYAGTSAFVEEYVELVKDKSILRQVILASQKVGKSALEDPQDVYTILDEANNLFSKISQNANHLYNERDKIVFLEKSNNFLLTPPPNQPMLLEFRTNTKLEGFIPQGKVGMIVGAGGTGKTHLICQLGLSVASGCPFLANFFPVEKGSVFFGFGENQINDVHRSLYKASKHLRDELNDKEIEQVAKNLSYLSFCGRQAAFVKEDGSPTKYFRILKQQLINTAPEDGWRLLIFDPVSRLAGPAVEKDNAVATAFIALLEELTIDLPGNPTVLFTHHVNKMALNSDDRGNQSVARGASALTDGARFQFNFYKSKDEKEADIVWLEMSKSNFTKICDIIRLKKDFDGFLQFMNFKNDDGGKFIENVASKRETSNKKSMASTSNSYTQDILAGLK
jgi:DnaB helicase-like protein/AAA domain-containing protein